MGMIVGSLFSGIGGFDLAARWMGWRTAWFSEINPYSNAVLKKHWPDVPNYGDITQIDPTQLEPIDILVGGFPCQDISVAGRGAGLGGHKSILWWEYFRFIKAIRPKYAVIENSPRLRSLGLDKILQALYEIGYDAEWHCITASHVGGKQKRDRLWVVAYPHGESFEHLLDRSRKEGSGEITSSRSLDALEQDSREIATGRRWQAEPSMARVAYGIPNRVDRSFSLGNAIVPQVALLIFQAIQHRVSSNG